jgi:hypothetical protein
MRNIIYLIVLAVSLALTLYFYFQYDQTKARLAETQQRLEQQDRLRAPAGPDTIDLEDPIYNDTLPFAPPASAQFEGEIGTLSTGDLERLRQQGLRNPETDLQNDLLRKQKSLLPTQGTMGGTMAVRDVRILSDRLAMAYFEDGHHGGYMVLRYEVLPGGNITWRVLDTYMI